MNKILLIPILLMCSGCVVIEIPLKSWIDEPKPKTQRDADFCQSKPAIPTYSGTRTSGFFSDRYDHNGYPLCKDMSGGYKF